MPLKMISRWPAWACLCVMLSTVAVAWGQEPPQAPILAAEPETLEEHFEAALLMLRLARPELANQYVEQLLALEPSDEDLLALRARYGTSTFLELTRLPEVEAAGVELLERVNAATLRQVTDPGYVESILPKLVGTARERDEAITELRHLGPYAIPPMLIALQAEEAIDRDVLIHAMARLGAETVPPLIGAVQSPSERVRAAVVEVLGVLGSEGDVIWLWHPAFSESQPPGIRSLARQAIARIRYADARHVGRVQSFGAAKRLLETSISHLSGRYEWPELLYEINDDIPVWTWDPGQRTVVEHVVSRPRASIHFAERLARESADLAPADEDAPLVLIAALLARDVEEAGWNRPLPIGPGTAHDLAVLAGPEASAGILRLALDQGIVSAALGSIQALALNGSREMLRPSNGTPVIIAALNSPLPRVQFMAALTILQWEPQESFPGARRVVEILARALNAQARSASVVVDPNVGRGTTTAAMFRELGFQPALAATGMEGFRLAAGRGNVELAVLHPNVIRWELSQTLANLRADSRTANIPVVIYGPAGARSRVEPISMQFSKVAYVSEAPTALEVNRELRPLLARISPPPLTQQQRGREVELAAFWLRRIAVRNLAHVFDLVPAEDAISGALEHPRVGEDATVALGAIPRPSAQRQLLQRATAPAVPADLRQLAAMQLGVHIQRFGLLLRETEVRALREAWETEPEPLVRTALASVIGTLKPSPQAVRRELLALPMSPAPVGGVPVGVAPAEDE